MDFNEAIKKINDAVDRGFDAALPVLLAAHKFFDQADEPSKKALLGTIVELYIDSTGSTIEEVMEVVIHNYRRMKMFNEKF